MNEARAPGSDRAGERSAAPCLTPEEERRARETLPHASLDELTRYMADRQIGRAADEAGEGAGAARALGWIEPGDGRFTAAGRLAADSCREWLFWVERGRALPFAREAPQLGPERFAGRAVLEIGCGMGANLMSLTGVAGSLAGVEPVTAYRQLGDLFRERAGLPPVEIRQGSGEAIPAGDGEADVVLCVTSYQYMDLRAALVEFARVLRPGGEAIVIGGVLEGFVLGVLGSAHRRSPGLLRSDAMTIANTLGYMATGRRPIPARGGAWTSRPIYPAVSHVIRLIRRAGLSPEPAFRIGPETCFLSRKTGDRA